MMAETSSETTIASSGRSCSRIFPLLSQSLEKSELRDQLPASFVREEGGRYELWARNIAALQDARLPSSLEYRIRNNESALRIIKKSLVYLEESLDMGKFGGEISSRLCTEIETQPWQL